MNNLRTAQELSRTPKNPQRQQNVVQGPRKQSLW